VDTLLRELREAVRGLNHLEAEAAQLLALQGQQSHGEVPFRGLDRLEHDLKCYFENPVIPPIPRSISGPERRIENPPPWGARKAA
jgi:hypothetical protein